MFAGKVFLRAIKYGVGTAVLAFSTIANAQSLLFDGGFESGTFQGWTSGGVNGGFAAPAAKGIFFNLAYKHTYSMAQTRYGTVLVSLITRKQTMKA